ncbi:Lachesin [Halotydeus destructor]|nr:Lachesin [Halotydeus destructor]
MKLTNHGCFGVKMATLLLLIMDSHSVHHSGSKHLDDLAEEEPEFAEPVANVTVAVGRDAKLTCNVRNLGSYRVGWLRVTNHTILAIHHQIITRNYRIGISHSDAKQWNLHLTDVQERDRGGYMCQLNTVPMKYQIGHLDVVVPPDIVTSETSSDVMVRENMNATLVCRAKGYPKPKITWRREDKKPIEYGNWQEHKMLGIEPPKEYESDTLTINKVSRLHMAAYLCIASNGVPPSVSKRILLNVHFPPMIWVPNQLIGAPLGGEVTLQCNTEAFPISINYWTKDDDDALMPSDKYDISNTEKSYKVQMVLRIRYIEPADFGTYKCFARNSLSSTEGSIKLYETHVAGGMSKSGPRRNPLNARVSSDQESHVPGGMDKSGRRTNPLNARISSDQGTKSSNDEEMNNGIRRNSWTIASLIFSLCHYCIL